MIAGHKRIAWIASMLLLLPHLALADPADDARMAWWRAARFGMFIHWGLYSIPAGEWQGQTRHAEWIRTTAQIPLETYEKFVGRFDPVKFDADAWVRLASQAGMKYVVITSKHHDGFCLFDSKLTDFDVMSTPFHRDIMKEMADACRKNGLKICWYHSIMDWHHPDYLPRRGWEKSTRSAEGADFDRFVKYLHGEVTELLTNYGDIGVMWFDGEWEGTWSHKYGGPLYDLCRRLQPKVIVNNRVDKGRGGMAGLTEDAKYAGDFGTPEQEIPATGLPGVDWETCMTMNDHWGFNKADKNFKSSEDLIRKLCDIASKGGNFLLNVGPTSEGLIPEESVVRLEEIGRWMKVNGDAIYGTHAGPFKSLPWGRCTQKTLPNGDTRLYLFVFDWPADGQLVVPGLFNKPNVAQLMADKRAVLPIARREDALRIRVGTQPPDPIASVVVLDIAGKPDVSEPPEIHAASDIFVDALDVDVTSNRENIGIRYTADGGKPSVDSPRVDGPIRIRKTTTISARSFREQRPVSDTARRTFTRVEPLPAIEVDGLTAGLHYDYYEGEWQALPDFDKLEPLKSGAVDNFTFEPRNQAERFGFRYRGYVIAPRAGVYTFYVNSDDGSRLYFGDRLVVDNDGLHGATEKSGRIALAAGAHPITVEFFERTGGDELSVSYAGPGIKKSPIPPAALRRRYNPPN